MSGHTKGPWGIELRTPNHENGNCVNHSVVNEEGFTLIDVWASDIHPCKTYEEATANAMLISKAPEMLEMLEKIEHDLRHGYNIQSWVQIKIQQLIKSATEL